MKVLVAGATGFTGSYTIPLLLKKGYSVRCFVRESSDRSHLPVEQVEFAEGNLEDAKSIERALDGMDAFVNIASLGFGYDETLIPALEQSTVRRAVFVSTTSIFTQLNPDSKTVRLRAEELIKKSNLYYTILRPTMIFGSSRDRNMCRLIRFISRSSFIPVFGSGEYLQQPVFVGDVAWSIAEILGNSNTIFKEYNIGGAEPLTYNQVIDIVAEEAGKRIKKNYIPYKPVTKTLSFFEKFSIPLPIKAEQILRLNEHKAFSYTDAEKDFGYNPRHFRDVIRAEMEEMGILKAEGRGQTCPPKPWRR